jgi:hypothetical protein
MIVAFAIIILDTSDMIIAFGKIIIYAGSIDINSNKVIL